MNPNQILTLISNRTKWNIEGARPNRSSITLLMYDFVWGANRGFGLPYTCLQCSIMIIIYDNLVNCVQDVLAYILPGGDSSESKQLKYNFNNLCQYAYDHTIKYFLYFAYCFVYRFSQAKKGPYIVRRLFVLTALFFPDCYVYVFAKASDVM